MCHILPAIRNAWLIWYENLAPGFPSYTLRSTENYGGRPHDGDLHAVFLRMKSRDWVCHSAQSQIFRSVSLASRTRSAEDRLDHNELTHSLQSQEART